MKIATWNMQGGTGTDNLKNSTLYQLFSNEELDVICIQEATDKLENFDSSILGHSDTFGYNSHSSRTQRTTSVTGKCSQYTCTIHRWGTNPRCSLVTYFKAHLMNRGICHYTVATCRPMLWIHINVGGVEWYIGNVHLPSGAPGFAFDVFNHFKNWLHAKNTNYIIAGDFNMDFQSFLAPKVTSGILPQNELNRFHHPERMTQQSGGILDYIYYAGNVQMGSSEGFVSDHRQLFGITY